MTEEIKKPPDGVLADVALKATAAHEAVDSVSVHADTPSIAMLPVDPGYIEPISALKLAHMADALMRKAIALASMGELKTEEYGKLFGEQKVLISFLLQRVQALEGAIIPIATCGMMYANARICLDGIEDNSPEGGTWISNPPNGIQMQANAGLFYRAVDVLGRNRIQEHMEAVFKRVQELNVVVAEKAAHEANNTLVGPIGGPIDGRVH